jgi:hypothetical protein
VVTSSINEFTAYLVLAAKPLDFKLRALTGL